MEENPHWIGHSSFFTEYSGGKVVLGILTPYGEMDDTFTKSQWIGWLKEELKRVEPIPIPKVFEEG